MVNKHARRMRAAHQSPRKPPPQIVVGAGQPAVSSTLASRTPAQLISDGRLKEALHMLVDAFRQTLPLPAHHRGESDDAPSSLVTLPAVRKQRQITTPPTALQPSKDALLVFREALRATRPLLIAPDGTALHFEAPGDLHFYQKPEPAVGDGAKASLEKEGSTDSSGDAFVSTAHANDEDLDNASGPFVDASAADFKAESKSNGAATPLDNSTLAKMLSAMDALSEAMRAVKSNPDLASRVIAHRSVHYDMDDFPALMRTVKNGKHIASPVFYVGRSRWYVQWVLMCFELSYAIAPHPTDQAPESLPEWKDK